MQLYDQQSLVLDAMPNKLHKIRVFGIFIILPENNRLLCNAVKNISRSSKERSPPYIFLMHERRAMR